MNSAWDIFVCVVSHSQSADAALRPIAHLRRQQHLLSDGQRSYSWDAENRLIGITYPGVSAKATAFTYDGLNRRTAIASTPAGGGSAVTTSYLWCGSRICQARNASNAVTRGYYAEGEYVPGTPTQTLYYGQDQIGSARRVFASTMSGEFHHRCGRCGQPPAFPVAAPPNLAT